MEKWVQVAHEADTDIVHGVVVRIASKPQKKQLPIRNGSVKEILILIVSHNI
jgi:hypothetical protein